MNDVLVPLCERYHCDFVSLAGECSITYCLDLFKRAKGRNVPTRVLVISDFDDAGESIPQAIARKAEFFIRKEGLDVDLQLQHIALTAKQVEEFGLPRTPSKGKARDDIFEERHGEGVVELDALEALHPGSLGDLVEREICRYRDSTIRERMDEAKEEAGERIDEINTSVQEAHADEIADLRAECEEMDSVAQAVNDLKTEMQDEMQRAVDEIFERYKPRFDELVPAPDDSPFTYRAEQVLERICEDLDEATPSIDELVEWPTPTSDDPDDDPLYDSSRDYLKQIERYRKHRGKEANPTIKNTMHDRICQMCGAKFQSRHRDTEVCSITCKRSRQKTASRKQASA